MGVSTTDKRADKSLLNLEFFQLAHTYAHCSGNLQNKKAEMWIVWISEDVACYLLRGLPG